MEKIEFLNLKNQKVLGYKSETVNPQKDIIIVHGTAEYGARYKNFIEELNRKKINCYTLDHPGHGRSIKELNQKAGAWEKDSFETIVDNIFCLVNFVKKKQDEKRPIVVFGHSLGSFLVQAFYQKYSSEVDGIILSGSSYNLPTYRLGRMMTAVMSVFYRGKRGYKVSKLILASSNSFFNKKIKPFEDGYKTKNAWLSINEDNVKDYDNDPLCGYPCSFNFFYSMFKGQQKEWKKKSLLQIKNRLPMLLISGEDDPVGNFSKGVYALEKFYKPYTKTIKTIIYPTYRHEILNEKDPSKVYQDIEDFLSSI